MSLQAEFLLRAHTGGTAAALGALLEQLEGALLGYVAELAQAQDGLLASGLLAAADDASALGLDQILLLQATGSVLGGAVEDLGLGTQGLDLGATLHRHGVVLTSAAVLAVGATSRSHSFLFVNAE